MVGVIVQYGGGLDEVSERIYLSAVKTCHHRFNSIFGSAKIEDLEVCKGPSTRAPNDPRSEGCVYVQLRADPARRMRDDSPAFDWAVFGGDLPTTELQLTRPMPPFWPPRTPASAPSHPRRRVTSRVPAGTGSMRRLMQDDE